MPETEVTIHAASVFDLEPVLSFLCAGRHAPITFDGPTCKAVVDEKKLLRLKRWLEDHEEDTNYRLVEGCVLHPRTE